MQNGSNRARPLLPVIAGLALLPSAQASELAYTFLDFQALDSSVDAAGTQSPVPLQTVNIATDTGDGIAVAGSMAAGNRFYVGGIYKSSIIDVHGVISSPLVTLSLDDQFDLTQTRLSFGFLQPIGESFDFVAEVSYDSATYDFGSLAGENFDIEDSGVGAQLGFRWNPVRAFELFVFGRASPVAKANLSTRELESDMILHTGLRWYFFEDLGVGIEFESGNVETTTISMRFGFGDLPW
jgi:hypothetical protein